MATRKGSTKAKATRTAAKVRRIQQTGCMPFTIQNGYPSPIIAVRQSGLAQALNAFTGN